MTIKMTNLLTLLFLPFLLTFSLSLAAQFDITNKCSYTLWPAAIPGGGRQLNPGETWQITVSGTTAGRIWARTNCTFDGSSGGGKCETGDCGGLLECRANGSPPDTLAEFALDQFSGRDFYDISLVDGFNVPVDISPTDASCRGTRCAADIVGMCPAELRAPGACNSPCTVFRTAEYCCFSGSCNPTSYSNFFRRNCPDAYYGFTSDDQASTLTCTSGTNYTVTFCPS